MIYKTVLWILLVVLLITFSIVSKKKNRRLNIILVTLMLLIFIGQIFLSRQLFGKWNAISKIENKDITQILIQPSEPNWQINLTGNDFIISNKKQIDTIIDLLQNAEVYFPRHPNRIWETNLIFISSEKDSFQVNVRQTENNGTIIQTPTNEWRKDKIGDYLVKLVSFNKPFYGDTSTTRF